jgi:hypothetical protein
LFDIGYWINGLEIPVLMDYGVDIQERKLQGDGTPKTQDIFLTNQRLKYSALG